MTDQTPEPKRWKGKTLEEWAMDYAMLLPSDYDSNKPQGDGIESEASQLRINMMIYFGGIPAIKAINHATDILKMVDFHPPSNPDKEWL